MNIFSKTLVFLLLGCTLLFAKPVGAAEISFFSAGHDFASSGDFTVQTILDTEGQPLNAIEGEIIFPSEIVEISDLQLGNSAVNFWVNPPKQTSPNVISFSGISPGGFWGNKQKLFSVIFKAKKDGHGIIQANNIKILLSDGKGTPVAVKTQSFSFEISPDGVSQQDNDNSLDREKPESFRPLIANDKNIFNNQNFLVFVTEDKGSGINHYEVKEGARGEYVLAESPYLLKNQSLTQKIYVKAVDNNHNEIVVTITPKNAKKLYLIYSLFVIILIVIFILFSRRKIWQIFASWS